jgi:hypothetical protein
LSGPPFLLISRLIVEGARPRSEAIVRIESPATRPLDISSLSFKDRDLWDLILSGGRIPPVRDRYPWIDDEGRSNDLAIDLTESPA